MLNSFLTCLWYIFCLFYHAGQYLHIWVALLSVTSEMLKKTDWHQQTPTSDKMTCLITHCNIISSVSQSNGLGLVVTALAPVILLYSPLLYMSNPKHSEMW